jgi:hypothetical protein
MGRSGDCFGKTRQGVCKRDRVSDVTLDIGGFTVAFDADHPIGRELIVAADLPAAETPASIPRNGWQGNTR